MDPGFETVWRRVTEVQAADDEQTRLRRWIADETEAARVYSAQLRYSTDRRVKETLTEILHTRKQRIRQLRALFFLRTGERPEVTLPEMKQSPLLTVLRERYEAELSLAASYRKAVSSVRADTVSLCEHAADGSERNALLLRQLLERLL